MPEPITLEALQRELAGTEQRIITETEKRFTKKIDDATVPHFTAIQNDLEKISDRLHERRIIKLAETVGRPDLATPITRPIGA